ncbi:fimbrial protein [Ralstonia chuxiongensis]|uniref:Type 1 fimbrial protein n=1 Tax=Ralstonia chuxiongensis TaxID=2957504 RepID=A0AA42BH45_9RALS|nr:fimbrial protein [Ralstonia chuxiongensis]MCP1172770.1 type 1 fimbrial protein [Ralstonia chuxiongensis]
MSKIFSMGSSNRLFGGFCVLVTTFWAIFFVAPAHAQTCSFINGNTNRTVTFTIPRNLSMPRNPPVGTVVWESSTHTHIGANEVFRCNAAYRVGVTSSVGGWQTVGQTEFPIGNTGLAWSLIANNRTIRSIYGSLTRPNNGASGFDRWQFKLVIKTIKSVSAGATIPGGDLGHYSIHEELNGLTFKTSNQASVSTLSCKTPDVTVKMGDQNRVRHFNGVGTSLAPVNFSIALKECPEGLTKVSYLLKPNTQIVDAARSVVALDATSIAKGVGLQILDEGGKPAVLNKKIAFSGYETVGGNFSIPFKAAYHQTAPVVEAGSANSSLTLVMSYE